MFISHSVSLWWRPSALHMEPSIGLEETVVWSIQFPLAIMLVKQLPRGGRPPGVGTLHLGQTSFVDTGEPDVIVFVRPSNKRLVPLGSFLPGNCLLEMLANHGFQVNSVLARKDARQRTQDFLLATGK